VEIIFVTFECEGKKYKCRLNNAAITKRVSVMIFQVVKIRYDQLLNDWSCPIVSATLLINGQSLLPLKYTIFLNLLFEPLFRNVFVF